MGFMFHSKLHLVAKLTHCNIVLTAFVSDHSMDTNRLSTTDRNWLVWFVYVDVVEATAVVFAFFVLR